MPSTLVEEVSGTSLSEALRQRIFDPLEMHDSHLGSFPSVVPRRASGYESKLFFDGLKVAHAGNASGFYGPGAVCCSPRSTCCSLGSESGCHGTCSPRPEAQR